MKILASMYAAPNVGVMGRWQLSEHDKASPNHD